LKRELVIKNQFPRKRRKTIRKLGKIKRSKEKKKRKMRSKGRRRTKQRLRKLSYQQIKNQKNNRKERLKGRHYSTMTSEMNWKRLKSSRSTNSGNQEKSNKMSPETSKEGKEVQVEESPKAASMVI
jgi:hypothetical protein